MLPLEGIAVERQTYSLARGRGAHRVELYTLLCVHVHVCTQRGNYTTYILPTYLSMCGSNSVNLSLQAELTSEQSPSQAKVSRSPNKATNTVFAIFDFNCTFERVSRDSNNYDLSHACDMHAICMLLYQ